MKLYTIWKSYVKHIQEERDEKEAMKVTKAFFKILSFMNL